MSQALLSTIKQLISGMDEGLVIFNQSGEILHASHDLHKLLDETLPEKATIYDYVIDTDGTLKTDIRNINTSKYIDVRVLLLRKGTPFPARLRLAAWSLSKNEFLVLGSVVDVTLIERKRRINIRKALTIEYLSRSPKIREGKINDAINEILKLSCRAVNTTRVNAWFFSKDRTLLEPVGNFDSRENAVFIPDPLTVIEKPKYFDLFESRRIIIATNAQKLAETSELKDSYLIPNKIVSLMDVPIRSEGKIIGVVCFEQVKEPRHWSLEDQKFGLIIAQFISLAYETHNRKKIQQELELFMHKQKSMCHEMNHRIVGNLEIIKRLIELQVKDAGDVNQVDVLRDSVSRIDTVSLLHELLSDGDQEVRVSIKNYMNRLGNSIKNLSLGKADNLQLIVSSESAKISSNLAVCLGVIVNEAVMNSLKHGFNEKDIGVIRVDFKTNAAKGELHIFDNGKGYNHKTLNESKGFKIMRDMAEHINGNIQFDGSEGSKTVVSFPLS